MIECPDCGGEGYTENLIGLSYSGDQRWRVRRCETCDGTGLVEAKEREEESEEE